MNHFRKMMLAAVAAIGAAALSPNLITSSAATAPGNGAEEVGTCTPACGPNQRCCITCSNGANYFICSPKSCVDDPCGGETK